MEGFQQLISQVRDHYLQQFRAFVEVQQQQWPNGHAEVKFELSDKSELFRRLYCTDFVAKADDGLVVREMFPDRILEFEEASFQLRGVPVIMERLVWDDVRLHHDADALGDAELGQWFDYWFDVDDRRLDPASEIAGVIHSLSTEVGQLNVDFGTADAEAFWDVLDRVAAAGATNIRVTSGREPASS